MTHECSCGATFETLTRYRLHQRDDCSDRDLDLDVRDDDAETIAEQAVTELLVCDVCGAANDGAEAIERDSTAAGIAVTLTFDCIACGATNENTAILSGGSA